MPEGARGAGEPLTFGGGPVPHEAILLKDLVLLRLFEVALAAEAIVEVPDHGRCVRADEQSRCPIEGLLEGQHQDELVVAEQVEPGRVGGVGQQSNLGRRSRSCGEGLLPGVDRLDAAVTYALQAVGLRTRGPCHHEAVVGLVGGAVATHQADAPGGARGCVRGAKHRLRVVGAPEYQDLVMAPASGGELGTVCRGALTPEARPPVEGPVLVEGLVGDIADVAQGHLRQGAELDVVETNLLGRCRVESDLAAHGQAFVEADDLDAVQAADDLILVDADQGPVPLIAEQGDLHPRQDAHLALATLPQAQRAVVVTARGHVDREGVEIGRSLAAVVEQQAGLALVHLHGRCQFVLIEEVVARGDHRLEHGLLLRIESTPLERVEVRALVGREGDLLDTREVGFGAHHGVLHGRMDTPVTGLDSPGVELVGGPFLNHEVGGELLAGHRAEQRLVL